MTDDELFILFCVVVGTFFSWITLGCVVYLTTRNARDTHRLTEYVRQLDRDLLTVERKVHAITSEENSDG